MKLTDWLKDNPNAIIFLDNDCWYGFPDRDQYEGHPHDGEWLDDRIAYNHDFEGGDDSKYGSDILRALAEIHGLSLDRV